MKPLGPTIVRLRVVNSVVGHYTLGGEEGLKSVGAKHRVTIAIGLFELGAVLGLLSKHEPLDDLGSIGFGVD